MKLLEKFKNMFTEEVEVEEEPIKKETIQVEIPAPSKKKTETPKVEVPKVEIPKEQPAVSKEVVEEPKPEKKEEKEEKFSFPVFFDDKDFEEIKKQSEKKVEEPPLREKKYNEPSYREAYRNDKKEKELYQGNTSIRMKREEKKVFKPTPIISPIYGVLDKNYKREDIQDKKETKISKSPAKPEITVDDIRKKAYGTLEDDLEMNLAKEQEPEKEEKELFDIFEEFDHISLSREEKNKNIEKKTLTEEEKEELADNMVEEELNHPHETTSKEDDLFQFIDTLYDEKEDKK